MKFWLLGLLGVFVLSSVSYVGYRLRKPAEPVAEHWRIDVPRAGEPDDNVQTIGIPFEEAVAYVGVQHLRVEANAAGVSLDLDLPASSVATLRDQVQRAAARVAGLAPELRRIPRGEVWLVDDDEERLSGLTGVAFLEPCDERSAEDRMLVQVEQARLRARGLDLGAVTRAVKTSQAATVLNGGGDPLEVLEQLEVAPLTKLQDVATLTRIPLPPACRTLPGSRAPTHVVHLEEGVDGAKALGRVFVGTKDFTRFRVRLHGGSRETNDAIAIAVRAKLPRVNTARVYPGVAEFFSLDEDVGTLRSIVQSVPGAEWLGLRRVMAYPQPSAAESLRGALEHAGGQVVESAVGRRHVVVRQEHPVLPREELQWIALASLEPDGTPVAKGIDLTVDHAGADTFQAVELGGVRVASLVSVEERSEPARVVRFDRRLVAPLQVEGLSLEATERLAGETPVRADSW